MRNIIVKCLLFFVVILFCLDSYSQKRQNNVGLGLVGAFNIQTVGLGGGARMDFPITKRISFIPQFTYFPSFNKIEEMYINGAFRYTLKGKNINRKLYLIAAGGYNAWFNFKSFNSSNSKLSNPSVEIGYGVYFGRSYFRPFIENRYNIKWKEGTIYFGGIFYINSKSKKGSKTMSCPAF